MEDEMIEKISDAFETTKNNYYNAVKNKLNNGE